MDVSDEIEALKGIYCSGGELETYKDGDGQSVLHFQLSLDATIGESEVTARYTISLTLTLLQSYPATVPNISISSTDLTRGEHQDIMKTDLMEFARGLPSEPMVMNIVCWVQEHAHEYINSPRHLPEEGDTLSDITEPPQYAILHLDHMRAKNQYVKTLTSWAKSGSICGRIIFCRHLILVILVGDNKNIKDFISNLKTQTVDVDSRGRSCKEKMMSVVSEGRLTGICGQNGFLSIECTEVTAAKAIFEEFSLKNIFEEAIHPLLYRNTKEPKPR